MQPSLCEVKSMEKPKTSCELRSEVFVSSLSCAQYSTIESGRIVRLTSDHETVNTPSYNCRGGPLWPPRVEHAFNLTVASSPSFACT